MLNVFKKILMGTATLVVLLLLLPVILSSFVYIGLVWLWLFMLRRLRGDPNMRLQPFVAIPEQTNETIEYAQKYFDDLVKVIAGSYEIKDTKKSYSEWQLLPSGKQDARHITLRKEVNAKNTIAEFTLEIEEVKDDKGSRYYPDWDGDDSSLADGVHVKVALNDSSKSIVELIIQYDQIAAYFCSALLDGDGKYNLSTEQWWAYLDDKNIWLVKYAKNLGSDYGLRVHFGNGKARSYWFDESI